MYVEVIYDCTNMFIRQLLNSLINFLKRIRLLNYKIKIKRKSNKPEQKNTNLPDAKGGLPSSDWEILTCLMYLRSLPDGRKAIG